MRINPSGIPSALEMNLNNRGNSLRLCITYHETRSGPSGAAGQHAEKGPSAKSWVAESRAQFMVGSGDPANLAPGSAE
jgi:hypothetical protein